jgi:hypothetical protein
VFLHLSDHYHEETFGHLNSWRGWDVECRVPESLRSSGIAAQGLWGRDSLSSYVQLTEPDSIYEVYIDLHSFVRALSTSEVCLEWQRSK